MFNWAAPLGNSAVPMGNKMMQSLPLSPRTARKAEGFWRERMQGAALPWHDGCCVATMKKPDPFEPGGSGSCPKPPFQPLACALFSWAFLVWAAARASPPAAPLPLVGL